jgi:GntR family transcriptional regulator/MocR family aminotransferase
LRKELKGKIKFDLPSGGFAVWAQLGDRDPRQVAAQAQKLGLAISDGQDYWHQKPGKVNGIRLGFAALNEKEMEEAVAILKKCLG